ncbi:hypothetical protein QBC34DRAFT_441875 [Podospora aff. communis PSN243]|uniref:AA1-like domain-containing protein n=1 Tax=Podospora aff. communis PSN243 TaxID=3040156 RepID=A0AAV9G9S8_9PEZI|nr:hypothetical protein QBC34DRAFT_441875 [Podospora aff. communis PSN243]
MPTLPTTLLLFLLSTTSTTTASPRARSNHPQNPTLPGKPTTHKHSHAALPICNPQSKIPRLFSLSHTKITYTPDESTHQGTAVFTLTNTLTKRSETLRCDLRFNHNCEFLGTPHDGDTRVWVQTDMSKGELGVTVSAPWRCDSGREVRGGRRQKASVTGTVEVKLDCVDGRGKPGSCVREEEVFGTGEVVMDVDGFVEEESEVGGKGKQRPPFPMTGRWRGEGGDDWKGVVGGKAILGMAKRGRAMAKALAHFEGKGKDVGKEKGEGKEDGKGKGKKKDEEVMNEKKFIDQVEHRLCSPSCLREARPEPASGSRYTKGLRISS